MKLLNARVIDGVGNVLERVDIEIEGEIFKSVTPSAEHASTDPANPQMQNVQDLSGYTVIPGLFDCHIHITADGSANPFALMQLESIAYQTLLAVKRGQGMIEAGITTTRDMGGKDYIEMTVKRAYAESMFPGPRLLVSGRVLTMTGGHGFFIGEEIDSPDEARKAARAQIKAGADCIKMMASGGVLTPNVDPQAPSLTVEELQAGFDEAHKAGKLSASHAQATQGIKNAIVAGVRTIEHGIWLDDAAVAMLRERGTFLVPTLAAPKMIIKHGLSAGIPKYAVDKSERAAEAHLESAAKAHAAGVKVACGSDAGTPFNLHADLFPELESLVEIGMSYMEAITAATSVSAEAMRLDDKLGRISVGYIADMVMFQADPLTEFSIIKTPSQVYKAGVRLV
jgi:imidazolonepropionase-like amidohydrolase